MTALFTGHFKPEICTPQITSRMKNHSNGTLPMAKKVSKENMEINESKAGQDFVPKDSRKHAIIETGAWETLPSMLKSRKMSSGVMMHGKFYVIGGGGKDGKALSCGEEYDFEAKKWRQIPYILALPNELYAADCLPMKMKYIRTLLNHLVIVNVTSQTILLHWKTLKIILTSLLSRHIEERPRVRELHLIKGVLKERCLYLKAPVEKGYRLDPN
uniref:Uncharacterized protein n=1 Tax=Tanacetum cinerariifolium TaxID=118510 RepID=A0A6L2P459_TANCI|nr:hypothetical protein [Tanacetum cinerariifolium]